VVLSKSTGTALPLSFTFVVFLEL